MEVKLSIPLGAHASKPSIEFSFEHYNFLVLRPVLVEIAYFNSANRQPFNAVWPKELQKRKIVDPSRGASLSSVERNFSKFSCKKFKELYFFIFWPILLKLHI